MSIPSIRCRRNRPAPRSFYNIRKRSSSCPRRLHSQNRYRTRYTVPPQRRLYIFHRIECIRMSTPSSRFRRRRRIRRTFYIYRIRYSSYPRRRDTRSIPHSHRRADRRRSFRILHCIRGRSRRIPSILHRIRHRPDLRRIYTGRS